MYFENLTLDELLRYAADFQHPYIQVLVRKIEAQLPSDMSLEEVLTAAQDYEGIQEELEVTVVERDEANMRAEDSDVALTYAREEVERLTRENDGLRHRHERLAGLINA